MALTRSTIDDTSPNPKEAALDDVLHWIWGWRLQLRRFIHSIDHEGQGNNHLEQRRSFSHTTYDEHLILVVGNNVVRALSCAEQLFPGQGFRLSDADGLRLLRNLYEHWDQQKAAFQDSSITKKRSGKDFAELFPEGKPWSIAFEKGDVVLAGVISLNQISVQLDAMEIKALELEQALKNEARA